MNAMRVAFEAKYPNDSATLKMYEAGSPAVSALDCIVPRHRLATWEAAWVAAQAAQPADNARTYAQAIAVYLWKKFYKDKAPDFETCDDLYGVLSQIDNMVAGLPVAQPAQMPGWLPISSAPKDGTDVIVMYMNLETQIVHNAFWLDHEDGPELSGWWSYDKSESSRVLLDDFMTPTHYMPLPPAPSADTSQKEQS